MKAVNRILSAKFAGKTLNLVQHSEVILQKHTQGKALPTFTRKTCGTKDDLKEIYTKKLKNIKY